MSIVATVINSGNEDAGAFLARFYKGDPQDGGEQIGADVQIAELSAGQSVEVNVTWQTDHVGLQPISLFIDSLDQVEELRENDNNLSADLSIRRTGWNQFVGLVEGGSTGAGSPFSAFDSYAYTSFAAGDRILVAPNDLVNILEVYDYTTNETIEYDLDRLLELQLDRSPLAVNEPLRRAGDPEPGRPLVVEGVDHHRGAPRRGVERVRRDLQRDPGRTHRLRLGPTQCEE